MGSLAGKCVSGWKLYMMVTPHFMVEVEFEIQQCSRFRGASRRREARSESHLGVVGQERIGKAGSYLGRESKKQESGDKGHGVRGGG